jgi:hypothetical protein
MSDSIGSEEMNQSTEINRWAFTDLVQKFRPGFIIVWTLDNTGNFFQIHKEYDPYHLPTEGPDKHSRKYYSDCRTCLDNLAYLLENQQEIFAPGHKPRSGCESGGRPHCSCPICWG